MNLYKPMPIAQRAFHANKLLQLQDSTSGEQSSVAQTSVIISAAPYIITLASSHNMQRGILWDIPTLPERRYAESASTTTTAASIGAAHAVFEEREKSRADTTEFSKTVRELRKMGAVPEAEALATRLETLSDDYLADYGQSLNVESLRTLIEFISAQPNLNRPIITATPDGNLFGEWKGHKRYLGVQFLPNRHTRYVAIRPNPQHVHTRIRSSGVVTADQLLTEIASYDVTTWAARAP
jgi:hypothetical protein